MKKLTVWALLATLVVAGSAFAVPRQVVADATFATGSPATTNNDDSCDIGMIGYEMTLLVARVGQLLVADARGPQTPPR